MAVLSSQRLRIQAALVDEFSGVDFPVVTYQDDGTPNDADDTNTVAAHLPILCNEVEAAFQNDDRYRRGDRDERVGWRFEVIAKFPREVLLELFETSLLRDPPVLPATSDLPQVSLRLVETRAEHPVQKNGSSGTTVAMTFEAQEGRS
jgi:hypothetical protein